MIKEVFKPKLRGLKPGNYQMLYQLLLKIHEIPNKAVQNISTADGYPSYSSPCSSCGRRPLPQPLSYKERGAGEGINHLGKAI